ncbi:hypothetical protein BV133_982 [Blastochloris viridis]|nr:hypothetical protein BV133_982 [Blastochloris viridis]
MLTLTSAVAADVTATRPDSLIAALQNAGYQAKLTKDATGDPMIESRAAGFRFRVVFFGCDNGANCNQVVFAAGFLTKEKPTLQDINDWNYDKALSKGAIDKDGDPHLRAGLWLQQPVSEDYFKGFLEVWDSSLGEFAKRFVK